MNQHALFKFAAVTILSMCSTFASEEGFRYNRKAFDSAFDLAHRNGKMLQEVFIPSRGIVISFSDRYEGQNIEVFHSTEPLNKYLISFTKPEVESPLENVMVPTDLLDKAVKIAKALKEYNDAKDLLISEPAIQELFQRENVQDEKLDKESEQKRLKNE